MILLLDPNPRFMQWCIVKEGDFSESKCDFRSEWSERIIEEVGELKRIKAIGYLLHHGGDEIRQPVSFIRPQTFIRLEKCIRFLPEYNDLILKAAQYWCGRLADIPHILLCDTAFFLSLPLQAMVYAIPYKLYKNGIRRYGGYGLRHQSAWEKTQSFLNRPARKLISIYLGNSTNIAAIKDGKPLETTIGFSSVEGIPSANSCGDMDPTIVFHLSSTGMSLEEINSLLTRESGFSGLLEKRCGFLDIVKGKDNPEISAIRDIFRYSILKYIGAFISILGGIDAVVFSSKYPEESLDLILEICHALDFLGFKCKTTPDRNMNIWNITEGDSKIEVLCLGLNKWEIMAGKARTLLEQGGTENGGSKEISR